MVQSTGGKRKFVSISASIIALTDSTLRSHSPKHEATIRLTQDVLDELYHKFLGVEVLEVRDGPLERNDRSAAVAQALVHDTLRCDGVTTHQFRKSLHLSDVFLDVGLNEDVLGPERAELNLGKGWWCNWSQLTSTRALKPCLPRSSCSMSGTRVWLREDKAISEIQN